MKKKVLISLLIFFACFFSFKVRAQIAYTFAATTGAYTANTTSLATTLVVASTDEGVSSSTNIGFTFTYGCVNYTTFQASSNGVMFLGTSIATGSASTYTNNLNTNTFRPAIAPLWDDLKTRSTGNVNYVLSGSAPNRILTVEWLNMLWDFSATNACISFQVKLYETTNQIDFTYSQLGGGLAGSQSASIGLSGPTSGDFYSLNGSGASPTSTYGTETANISTRPATNQIYRWTPSCASLTTGAINPTTINLAGCAGTATATVAFTASGMVAGNVYIAQLSDSSGDFSSAVNIGTLTSIATAGTITVTIPAGTIAGSGYQIQIVSSNPAVTGSASATFTINTSCVQSISLGTITPSAFTFTTCVATHTATVTFTSAGVSAFHAGNIDSLFMSDETGNFINSVYVGSLSTTATSGTITFTVPAGYPTSSLYQLQLISSNPNIESNLSSAFTITSSCIKPTITTGTLNATTYNLSSCAATATGTVSFTSVGTYSAGNVYTAQLSDPTGNFANPINIGSVTTTTNSGTITFTIPAGTTPGTGYDIQVVSSKPAIVGSSSADFTITATCVVTICPSITGIILNACNNPCNEGDGEVTLYNTQSYSISIAAIKGSTKIIQYYGSTAVFSSGSGTPNAYTGTLTAQPAVTTALNASTGCSGAFVNGFTAGTIPAGSTIMMVPNTFGSCQPNYNFSNICSGYKPIYVLYYETGAGSTTGQWNTSGNYANYQSGSNPKYISSDFGLSGCNTQYYEYNAGSENSGDVDGQAISFSGSISTSASAPTNAATYPYTTGCTLPVVLPISLIDFTAEKLKNNINLKWTTITENNNNYFNVEYSLNGTDFMDYAQVKGAGTSKTKKDYACIFNQKVNSSNIYFRLKQVNYNGTYTYSDIITYSSSIIFKSDLVAYYNAERDKVITHFYLDEAEFVNVSLYDVTGAKIQETGPINYSEGNNEIVLNASDKTGLYILVYQVGDATPIHKKIIVAK